MHCHYAECCNAECRILFTIVLNVIMLSLVMLSVVALMLARMPTLWPNLALYVSQNRLTVTSIIM
jgi:hypothetical protein